MKKLFKELMQLCPGRISVEIDQHKLYGETASDVINRDRNKYGIYSPEMIRLNTIIHVEALPVDKPMPHAASSYHYDIELALKDVLNQIKLWQPEAK